MDSAMNTKYLTLLAVLAAISVSGCRSPYYADRGAALGGLAGAGIGAAIGEHNGNPLAGAGIGAAVGAISGAAIGDSVDQDIARERAIIQQQIGRQVAGAATIADVVEMTRAGVDEALIVNHVRANGVAERIGTNEIIALTQAGVSPNVIRTMQSTGLPAPPRAAAPVIVEEHYYTSPRTCRPPHWHYNHHHHHRHRPGRVGVSLRL